MTPLASLILERAQVRSQVPPEGLLTVEEAVVVMASRSWVVEDSSGSAVERSEKVW